MATNIEAQYSRAVMEEIKEMYKECIKLSTANKINTKNAFDLQLIDHIHDIAISSSDGQMNFKIASSALDVGAKIYSNRVDCIQGVAQKVASSLMMAVDGQKGNQDEDDDQDVTQDDNNMSCVSETNEEVKKTKKAKTKKRQIKYTEDDAAISADIEPVILSEPVSADIQDNDMTSAAALLVHNQLVQEQGRPVFDLDYKETTKSPEGKDTMPISVNYRNVFCPAIIEQVSIPICSNLSGFLFVDKTSKMQGYDADPNESNASIEPMNDSMMDAPMDQPACDFDVTNYDDGVVQDDAIEADENIFDECQYDLNKTLETVAELPAAEYDHRLLNTWAGPHAWTTVRAPQNAKTTDKAAPKSTRKRIKLENTPLDFNEDQPNYNDDIAEKPIRHSTAILKKWKKLFKPQDHKLDEDHIKRDLRHTFLRPEETYHCPKTTAEALKTVDKDHDYTNRNDSGDDAPDSPAHFGGFDDIHDDSDDEFRADPLTHDDDKNGNIGAGLDTSQIDLEFAGEHLIEQPHTVAQVRIPYSRAAKKIDVRKLKHVMWNVLLPPEIIEAAKGLNTTIVSEPENVGGDRTVTPDQSKIISPTPSESAVHLTFSNLYGVLPVKVSHKMANDLSQPIAFVTLLHLANEKNLKLIPKQDLTDFIIEQDEITIQ